MLLGTGEAFLLEHNPKTGRDSSWSDNHDGTGKNWLGMQLMIIRDELSGRHTWTNWLRQHVNLANGQMKTGEWQNMVKSAATTTIGYY